MMQTNAEHVSRYAGLLAKQARQILAEPAGDAVQRQDGIALETFRPAGVWLTAPALAAASDDVALVPDAQQIHTLVAVAEQLADGVQTHGESLRLFDGMGHSRPMYVPFVLQMLQRAGRAHRASMNDEHAQRLDDALHRATRALVLREQFDRADTAMTLWKSLCWLNLQDAAPGPDAVASQGPQAEQTIDRIIALPGRDGALHTFSEADQLLDTWWFNELTGLHALANATLRRVRPTWRQRVHHIALHHLENIQADHVTSQPWALAAFLQHPETAVFGEQQMHETMTGLFSPFSKSTVLPGLLMADAAWTLHHWAREVPPASDESSQF